MSALSELQRVPHRRFNPLIREWVLVSPHRTQRPWLGKVEKLPSQNQPLYDSNCYLCPGNQRAGGARNPQYDSTFVFDNDYPALLPDASEAALDESGLIVARAESGLCRVVCFSPRHDLAVPGMTPEELRRVIDVWSEQYESLGRLSWVSHVQIFENRGALMGASNPHPHCQIWANATLPNQPAKEQFSLREYHESKKQCLLCNYLELEINHGERLIWQNDSFAVLVPFWAVWPFETLLLSKRHCGAISDLSAYERDQLAESLKQITLRFDKLFEVPFPYSMGLHQRPTDGQDHAEWHFHAHHYPPLLRSATVQKFMVGYEMLGTPQRDITPEIAAAKLREASR